MITRSPQSVPLRPEEDLLMQVLSKELKQGGQVHIFGGSALYRTVQTFNFSRVIRFRKCRNHRDCYVLRSIHPRPTHGS